MGFFVGDCMFEDFIECCEFVKIFICDVMIEFFFIFIFLNQIVG